MKDSAIAGRPATGRPAGWRGARCMAAAMVAVVLTVAVLAPAQAQTRFRPVAVVNDSAITGFDLAQRAQIMVALGFTAASADALRAEALDQLVQDRLKLQAGREIGLNPTPELIETGIAELARRSDVSPDEFRALMSNQGVTGMALEDFATAEAVWLQVIRARFANRVQPGEAEIDAELKLIEQLGTSRFRIREIGLPLVIDGRTEAQTRALAEQLYDSLNHGGDFTAAVAKYSRSPSAARGGDVGWVSTARMPPDLARAIAGLKVGEVSRPLSVPGGLSILKVLEKRSAGSVPANDPQVRERIRNRLIARKSARLAEGLLQEMRRDALIEVR